MDSGGRRSHRLVTNAPRPQDPHPNLSSPQQRKKAIAVDLSEYDNEFPPLSSGVSSGKGKSQDIIRSQLGHNRSNRSEHLMDMNKSGHSQTHSSFEASFSIQSGITDKNYMIGSDQIQIHHQSGHHHHVLYQDEIPRHHMQAHRGMNVFNITKHHHGRISKDGSEPKHKEPHRSASGNCTFCPTNASPQQFKDHAKTFTSSELHMAERRPHTPNRSPQCPLGSDILDENRYTRHYQGSSQDPSKTHHTESHGISSDCRCSFCPKSASPDQVQDHDLMSPLKDPMLHLLSHLPKLGKVKSSSKKL